MSIHQLFQGPRAALLGSAALILSAVGCQSTIGGQTLPSAYYLHDDVQYYPAGPEFRLSRQVEAIEAYNLSKKGVGSGLPGDIPSFGGGAGDIAPEQQGAASPTPPAPGL